MIYIFKREFWGQGSGEWVEGAWIGNGEFSSEVTAGQWVKVNDYIEEMAQK